MSLNVGFATLGVIPSVKGMRAELDKQTRGDFAAVGTKRGRELGDAAGRSAATSFKSRFGAVSREIAAPIAAGIAGAGVFEFFKGAIDGASDLAETVSKARVIFGEASKDVEKFAGDSTKNILLTKQAAIDASATFGVFGKSAGLTGASLSNFATRLTGLASDLSSFSNTTTEEAITAIGAALRGESEPIRAYGVLLDDASLRQEAFRQGLITTTKNALTPQQRVLAAYNLILAQTKDAQGDAARTQDGFANSSRIFKKELSELQTELGTKFLPALTKGVQFLSNDALPAFESTGGVVADSARAFNSLPTPIKAATAALVAFRAAQALGAGGATSAALASASSATDSLRLRTMLAADAYRNLRAGQLTITNGSGQFVGGVGRMNAALGALRVGASGAGAGLRRGLGSLTGLVGGPWGAAFIGGTAILSAFWKEQQKAKAFVDELTNSLDQQTGAITDQARKNVVQSLFDEKVLQNAKSFGLNLEAVTNAALGNKDAIAQVRSELDRYVAGFEDDRTIQLKAGEAAERLFGKITGVTGSIAKARQEILLKNEAEGKSAKATDDAATATDGAKRSVDGYATALTTAKNAVQELINRENARRTANLKDRKDAVALQQSLADAREEAGKGRDTLDISSQAGRDNVNALLDLANQWNSTSKTITEKRGAYDKFRQQFVDIATAMGASKTKANELANQLLGMPKSTPVGVTTPGMDKALADLKLLQERLRAIRLAGAIRLDTGRVKFPDLAAQPSGAPRVAAPSSRTTTNSNTYNFNGPIVANDPKKLYTEAQLRARLSAADGIQR